MYKERKLVKHICTKTGKARIEVGRTEVDKTGNTTYVRICVLPT
jgi:hypothetical protein